MADFIFSYRGGPHALPATRQTPGPVALCGHPPRGSHRGPQSGRFEPAALVMAPHGSAPRPRHHASARQLVDLVPDPPMGKGPKKGPSAPRSTVPGGPEETAASGAPQPVAARARSAAIRAPQPPQPKRDPAQALLPAARQPAHPRRAEREAYFSDAGAVPGGGETNTAATSETAHSSTPGSTTGCPHEDVGGHRHRPRKATRPRQTHYAGPRGPGRKDHRSIPCSHERNGHG